ncbi:hypothetical protein HOO65_020772 [Ceratocystis lukuohia]|uniref:Uncharacterized protein n=3 Tax=Ceratocystis TaxID=5157 RepID=A0A0F8B8I8_CERFI|nr:hypothetical protein CFO_g420 [Ceratocystis platani]PHH53968.1 hypothetical protein CFIMG_002860RAa [Ceratocystis fimbriata CBS 114723]
MAAAVRAGDTGSFGWFLSLGATPEAVAVLNDQPVIFTVLLIVLNVLIFQGGILWYIHHATMKPEQRKAKAEKKAKKKSAPAKK